MRHIQGSDRAQSLLLPASVEDYVGEDNPVRAIEAFVDGFDLLKAGFVRAEAKETGRPGYHPGDLLKLYLYGYLNRVRSSRRLEAECHRNLEVIWLLRGLRPDFKTIADFRRENAPAFKAAFRRFVYLCRQLDLFGKELLAVDGTRLKAVNSQERNFTREKLKTMLRHADERLAGYLAELAKADGQESSPLAGIPPTRNLAEKIATLQKRRGEYVAMAARLERTGETQVSLTDPDSRAMATYPKVGVGYNAQVAVDAKHKLIVEQEVTNAGSDLGQLAPTAIPAKEALGVETIQATADRGYFQGEDIAACAAAGIAAFVPKPLGRGAAASKGLFAKEAFTYDAQADTYRCPNGETLFPRTHWVKDGHRVIVYYHEAACKRCPIRAQCTSAKRRRQIVRWEGEAVLDAMAARLAANPQMTRLRRNTVEHPFGTIKHAMNQGHFLRKGLRQVRAEFSLSALAYNLLRVMNIVGVKALVEALRRRLRALARALRCAHDSTPWFYARVFTSDTRREQNFVAADLLA